MERRQARECAFKLLFERDFKKNDDLAELLALACEAGDIECDKYVETVYYGVAEQLEHIDRKISENAVGWKLNRISRVALTIMRLSTYEMLYMNPEEIPFNVSINEAVELAKKYDDDKAPAFVNGVLNAIAEKEGLKAQ